MKFLQLLSGYRLVELYIAVIVTLTLILMVAE